MIRKQSTGPLVAWGIAFLSIPIWAFLSHETTFQHNIKPFFIFTSQLLSHFGFSLFALSFLLAIRSKTLEDYFGGQDKMYHTHHTMGKLAFVSLLFHPVFIALRWVPENMEKAAWYIFPLHRRPEVDLGSYALFGLMILIALTLTKKISYDKWKISHKFMGLFFILGVVHIFLLSENVAGNMTLLLYTSVLSIAGISSYIYKTFLFDLLVRKYRYEVGNVKRMGDNIMEITLLPLEERVNFVPGQYCFFSFRSSNLSSESHPFTICRAAGEDRIEIMVKALGDFTRDLFEKLEEGVDARIEGPYGRFNYRDGARKQIWIGGGVGMAPFISWARDLKKHPLPDLRVSLYYCVNRAEEATHIEEFDNLKDLVDVFDVNLICADRDGFIKASDIDEIDGSEIYVCGPVGMRKNLLSGFLRMKLPAEKIHYEDFDFK